MNKANRRNVRVVSSYALTAVPGDLLWRFLLKFVTEFCVMDGIDIRYTSKILSSSSRLYSHQSEVQCKAISLR